MGTLPSSQFCYEFKNRSAYKTSPLIYPPVAFFLGSLGSSHFASCSVMNGPSFVPSLASSYFLCSSPRDLAWLAPSHPSCLYANGISKTDLSILSFIDTHTHIQVTVFYHANFLIALTSSSKYFKYCFFKKLTCKI